MAYWVGIFHDKPEARALRLKTRPAHLEYMKRLKARGSGSRVVLGFPLGEETMNGSCIIFCAETKDEVIAICDQDPYHIAGVFASREIYQAFGDSFHINNLTEPRN